jgi:ATP-dependent exoDNAse (exonuclease V) beta subunit
MTIHKAKGLGFPVAIVLMYEETIRGFKYILGEETDGVNLLRINKKISEASHFLQEKYEEERLKDLVNKLNTLYVGFTRAEDELYVIGVQGKRNQFPIDLLQTVDSRTGSKNAPRPRPSGPTQEDLKLYYHPYPIKFHFTAEEELNLEERLRGEFIHRVLYFIDALNENIESELERIIKRVNHELKADYPVGEMKKNLMQFMELEEIRPYFIDKPGRVIKREQDFSDPGGSLFRMDRVVMDEDQIVVIDYKTGTEKRAEKEYVSQLKNYIRILKEIYPDKNVEGMIAYVDLGEMRKVK